MEPSKGGTRDWDLDRNKQPYRKVRLDPTSSTENSVGCSSDGVRRASHVVRWRRVTIDGRRRWLCPAGRAVGAGVVVDALLGSRSPLTRYFNWRDSMPVVPERAGLLQRDGVAVRGGGENWIVDASKTRVLIFVLLLISNRTLIVRF